MTKRDAGRSKTPSLPTGRYQPHPMLVREKEYDEKIAAATGKPLAHWIGVAKKSGEAKQRACAMWLTKNTPLNNHQAHWVASYAVSGQDASLYEDPAQLVDALYSGPAAALRPLHERVVDAAVTLGDDVIVTSCKTMVPIYRKHVFAELRPSAEGVAVALALGDVPAKGRLAAASGRMPGDRLTHRVVVASEKDIGTEFRAWLAKAYEQGAGKMARSTSYETPKEFTKALAASKPATATWAACTPAMQRDFVQWIASAKQDATRTKRVATSIAKLASGKKRIY